MGGFVNTINSKMIISHEHVKGRKRGCRGVCYCFGIGVFGVEL
jgi:hypothetical protein